MIPDERIRQSLAHGAAEGRQLTPDIASRSASEREALRCWKARSQRWGASMFWACARVTATPETFWIRSRQCSQGEEVLNSPESNCPQIQNAGRRIAEYRRKILDAACRGNDILTRSTESLQHGKEGNFSSGRLPRYPSSGGTIDIDPKFAMAHAYLGLLYSTIGESVLSVESTTKA